MFKKLLVPLDGSEHSIRALETAIQIAKRFHAEITLLHVYSVTVAPVMMPEPATLTPAGVPVITPAEIASMVDAERKVGRQMLTTSVRKVETEGVHASTMLVEGNTVQEIVKAAKEGNFDLIVMGVRGISKLRELLVGSVSEGVIKHATCPVLVVK